MNTKDQRTYLSHHRAALAALNRAGEAIANMDALSFHDAPKLLNENVRDLRSLVKVAVSMAISTRLDRHSGWIATGTKPPTKPTPRPKGPVGRRVKIIKCGLSDVPPGIEGIIESPHGEGYAVRVTTPWIEIPLGRSEEKEKVIFVEKDGVEFIK